ncbi:MAG: hypothetical protein IT391_06015 [Nitrospira sp.]|nr:hypothetical protein [Nitrospira sp.]
MKKNTAMVWAFSLGLIGVIGILLRMSYLDTEHTKMVAACKQVKLGATEEEVRKIMGTPINTVPFNDGKKKSKILIFASNALASTPPQIEIDIETHQVVEVICDEEYRLAPAK